MVAGDWADSIEHWRQSSSYRSVACDGTEDLADHASRIDAPDLLETGRWHLLQEERFVHCCCQSMCTASMVGLLASPCHHLLVHRALPTLPGGLIMANI